MDRIMLLSNNPNSAPLLTWLREQGFDTRLLEDPLTAGHLEKADPCLVVSYNYRHIVPEEIIRLLPGRMINLHVSLLPWNRGSDPNVWSIIDRTPRGVTVHQLARGLDTGDVLLQQETPPAGDDDTLASTYEELNHAVTGLFREGLGDLLSGSCHPRPQEGPGSRHRRADLLSLLGGKLPDWSMTVRDLRKITDRIRRKQEPASPLAPQRKPAGRCYNPQDGGAEGTPAGESGGDR